MDQKLMPVKCKGKQGKHCANLHCVDSPAGTVDR